mgnify:FL=1
MSEEAETTKEESIIKAPELSKCKVVSEKQRAKGLVVSTRVTKVEHELALPVESVMVKVTVCVFRIEEQSKVFISIAQVAMARDSDPRSWQSRLPTVQLPTLPN